MTLTLQTRSPLSPAHQPELRNLFSNWLWELAPPFSIGSNLCLSFHPLLSSENTHSNDGGLQGGSQQLRTDKRVAGIFKDFVASPTWRSHCFETANEPATGLPLVLGQPPVCKREDWQEKESGAGRRRSEQSRCTTQKGKVSWGTLVPFVLICSHLMYVWVFWV